MTDPGDDAVTTPLPADLAGWLDAYRHAKTKLREWEQVAHTAQQHIADHLDAAGATIGTLNGKPAVRWKTVSRTQLDTQRLRADHPLIAAQYLTTSVSKRFTVPQWHGEWDTP